MHAGLRAGKPPGMTKFRLGLLFGFASGYYLGTKAGRERYDQLRNLGARVKRSGALDHAAIAMGRAKAVVDLGRERVHDAVDQPHDPVMATYIAN